MITDLLDVLDDSERAQKQLETTSDIAQIKEGVSLVFTKLKNTLTAKGLKPMEVVNEEFNPDLHEAITEIDAGEEMKGKVVAEVQKGYYLNDKIIRFAKVVVGKWKDTKTNLGFDSIKKFFKKKWEWCNKQ